MATKVIAWKTGTGYITFTYQGQGDGPVSVQSSDNPLGVERTQIITLKTVGGAVTKNLTVKQGASPFPVGHVENFVYTGDKQQILLPAGTYKLQAWGAQGGSVSGSYTATGAKGGYSEGTLTLSTSTIVYVFVGGQGSDASTSITGGVQNGGFNGGGGAPRVCQYNSGGENGISYPRPGGGASDISLVDSSVEYNNYRTNRSQASLLARLIVAGGGAGASARYTSITSKTTMSSVAVYSNRILSTSGQFLSNNYYDVIAYSVTGGKDYWFSATIGTSSYYCVTWLTSGKSVISYSYPGSATYTDQKITAPSNAAYVYLNVDKSQSYSLKTETTTTSYGTSNGTQVGGGTSGEGTNPGTQSGGGGELGKGANMTATNYRYASGGGGGGYYGGGASYNDSTTDKVNQSGGGSGYVDSSLSSAQTKAGNTSFPNTSGTGNETGHSGNGHIKITRLS